MVIEPKFINESSLQAGDVLISYARLMMGEPGCETGYSHAAIYLGSGEILESDTSGVKKSTVGDVLRVYDHIAVLRSHNLWSRSRIGRLKDFASRQIGKKFNIYALPRIEFLRQESAENSYREISDYFEGLSDPVETERNSYFCSELVASAFIDADIITESAAILLKPETLLPIDIAQDKIFGFFVGYIAQDSAYSVPDDDWFRTNV